MPPSSKHLQSDMGTTLNFHNSYHCIILSIPNRVCILNLLVHEVPTLNTLMKTSFLPTRPIFCQKILIFYDMWALPTIHSSLNIDFIPKTNLYIYFLSGKYPGHSKTHW